jgi:hypothetical protein
MVVLDVEDFSVLDHSVEALLITVCFLTLILPGTIVRELTEVLLQPGTVGLPSPPLPHPV